MPERLEDPEELLVPVSSMDEWLKFLPAALIAGIVALLALSARGHAVGWWVLGYLISAGAILFLCALHLRRLGGNARHRALPLAIVGVIAWCLAPLAFVLIPASLSVIPVVQIPAVPNPPEAHRSLTPLSGLVYVDPGKMEPRYVSRLLQALHDKHWQVTDDAARSAIILYVSVDTTVGPGLSVGSTTTWQATGDATLRAVPNNSDAPSVTSMQQGHAVALQPDHAADNAATDALDKVIEDFNVAAKKQGH